MPAPSNRPLGLLLAMFVGWQFFSTGAAGQTPPASGQAGTAESEATAAEPAAITEESVAERRKAAEAATDLADDVKSRVLELYDQAAQQLKRATESTAQTAANEADARTAAQRAADARVQLDKLANREPAEPVGQTVAELESELTKKQLELNQLTSERDAADLQPAERANRRAEIRSLLFSAPQRLSEIQTQLDAPPPPEEAAEVTKARRTELLARQRAAELEIPALQNELAKRDAEDAVDLVRLQRDLYNQRVALAEQELQRINNRLRDARARASQEAVDQAAEEAVAAQPLLRAFAEENRRLTVDALELTEPIEKTVTEHELAASTLAELQQDFEQTKARVKSVGLTNSIGSMLRNQEIDLPDTRVYENRVQRRQRTIDDVQFQLFEYNDQRSEIAHTSQPILNRLLEQAPDDMSSSARNDLTRAVNSMNESEREAFEQAASHVLQRKSEYLDTLIRNYDAYFDALVALSTTEQQMIQLSREFSEYINERVLWIRSNKSLLNSLSMDPTDELLLSYSEWTTLGTRLAKDVWTNPFPYIVVVFPVGIALYRWRSIRRELAAIGADARRGTSIKFKPTLRATLLTILLTIPIPAALYFFSWRLGEIAAGYRFIEGLAGALATAAVAVIPLEFLRQVCRNDGLGVAHFGWPESVVRSLRLNLKMLISLALPLLLIAETLRRSDTTEGQDALERLVFIVEMIVVAVFLRRVLHPKTGIFREYVARHQNGWIDRLTPVWYWPSVMAPIGLAALVAIGYYFTAVQLGWRLYVFFCWIVLLVLGRALLLRLLLVSRRRLLLKQLHERRAAEAATAANDALGADNAGQPAAPTSEDFGHELSLHTEQTQRLMTILLGGLALLAAWASFVDVLPALRMLDQSPVWTTSYEVTETYVPEGEEEAVTRTRTIVDPVTIADLAFGILIGVLTFAGARNIPGVMEISLLQRLPMESSVRYAITSIVSYGIVLLGIIVGANTIGLRWQQVQWLATALTFGLAFGLQEMFANFVSGIIILFERPVRVGDIVTVADTTGVVSRVRMRATTITDWDRKDFVVPNKEFITGHVLNWTLSDRRHRIVITVGVAYGSDTALAKSLLLKVAREHPLTLSDPEPLVTFEGFGDNSLTLVLRTFVLGLEVNLSTVDDLHTQIDLAFREAGIEIAFPQRDLHIRGVSDDILARLDGAARSATRSRTQDTAERGDGA